VGSGQQQGLLVLEGVEPLEVLVPGLEVLFAFDLNGDLEEVFGLEVLEMLELLVVDLDVGGGWAGLKRLLL
jgi:hypothetical protein